MNVFAIVATIILTPIPAAVCARTRILVSPPPVVQVIVIIILEVVDICEALPIVIPLASAGRHVRAIWLRPVCPEVLRGFLLWLFPGL